MRHHSSHNTANGVRNNCLRSEFAITNGIEHSGVCTQIAAPAHTYGCEHGNGIAINPTRSSKIGDKTKRCTHCTKRCDGEGYEVRIVETKEEIKYKTEFATNPGEQLHALVCCARELARGRGAEGKQHNQRRYYEHAGDNGKTHIHTGATTIEQRVEDTLEERFFILLRLYLLNLVGTAGILVLVLRVGLHHKVLHYAGGDDAAAHSTEQAYERLHKVPLPHHKHNNQKAHTKGCTKVGERYILELFEIGAEALVLCKRYDGRVVAQEGEHGTQRCHTRQVKQRLHKRAQEFFEQRHHAELHKHAAYGTRDDTNGHKIEYRIQQQVVRRAHNGVKHIGRAHLQCQVAEQQEEHHQANYPRGDEFLYTFHRELLFDVEQIHSPGNTHSEVCLLVEQHACGVGVIAKRV